MTSNEPDAPEPPVEETAPATRTPPVPHARLLFGATTLLSALLLFLVQPILGKRILPWFGGVASVWTTCLLFFQAMLVAGYLYCHLLVKHLRPRPQSMVHAAVLLVSCAVLPIEPDARWKPTGDGAPLTGILVLLTVTVGLPYLALSATGPLLQAWLAREKNGTVPYGLFAISNIGSMAALLGYPILVEPALGARAQSIVWSCGFGVFVVLCGAVAWHAARRTGQGVGPEQATASTGESAAPAAAPEPGPGRRQLALWIVLAACPSILLIGITRSLSLDVAPVPLLWVLPLAAYLATFIVCFGRPRWYARGAFGVLFLAALVAMVWLPPSEPGTIDIRARVAVYVGALFAFSMTGHGELVRLRPGPQHLTVFYLMIAAGGALGAAFAGILAPALFASDLELPIGLVLMTGVLFFLHLSEPGARSGPAGRRRVPLAILTLLALSAVLLQDTWRQMRTAVAMSRSFYGTLKVTDRGAGEKARRTLSHGRTVHGEQLLDPALRRLPTGYYAETSGGGIALHLGEGRPRHVGIIGLGIGTLLAHGRPGDTYRVYEIDSLVVDLARRHFTYLADTEATVSIVLGDARLALEREPDQAFDVLVVDAFSGDAIPAHLLTREAFELYSRHLSPAGILAVHTSNRFLDLASVVRLSAEANGFHAALIRNDPDEDRAVLSSTWALAARGAGLWAHEPVKRHAEEIEVAPSHRLWTDDDSSLWAFLR